MTFEELRVSYQCPEQMGRALFSEVTKLQDELRIAWAAVEAGAALHAVEQGLRIRAENKLAAASAPRRTYRQDEEK